MRIFVAVGLDAALRETVAGLRSRVNSTAASLRWVPPGNLHLTLKFLGEITERRTAGVVAAAREVAGRARPFSMTLAGMGAFPSPRRPRVVWVGVVEGSERLVALAGDLDAALRRMRFPKEAHPFRPHLTVARAKDADPAPDLSDTLRDLGGVMVGTQTVDTLFVMQSTLNPAGAIYHPVEEVRLGEAC
jgi:RNA 2',3'-cyclic 3'-phosphodiesterase